MDGSLPKSILYIDDQRTDYRKFENLLSAYSSYPIKTCSWKNLSENVTENTILVFAKLDAIPFLSKARCVTLAKLAKASKLIAVISPQEAIYLPLLKKIAFKGILETPLNLNSFQLLFKKSNILGKKLTYNMLG